MRKTRHLSIDEKRDWLAAVFRDESGVYTQADRFKAMVEDTRLAMLENEQKEQEPPPPPTLDFDLLSHLPPPLSEP